jgi:hypothetical protein
VKRAIATIHEAEAVFGVGIGFVIFDTFAKLIAAGGGDENQAKDQGAVFANVQPVKNFSGAHSPSSATPGKTFKRAPVARMPLSATWISWSTYPGTSYEPRP